MAKELKEGFFNLVLTEYKERYLNKDIPSSAKEEVENKLMELIAKVSIETFIIATEKIMTL